MTEYWGRIPLCPLLLPRPVASQIADMFKPVIERLAGIAAAADGEGFVPPVLGAEAYDLVTRWSTAMQRREFPRPQALHVWMTLDEALNPFTRDQAWKDGRGPFSLRCRIRNSVAICYGDRCPDAALAVLASVVAMAGNDVVAKGAGLSSSAAILLKTQKYAEAERLYMETLTLVGNAERPQALELAAVTAGELAGLTAAAHNGLADLAGSRGAVLVAADHRHKAIALLEMAADEVGTDPAVRDMHLAHVLQNLAVDLGAAGERERILALYDRAVELWSQHCSLDDAESAFLMRNRATHLGILAEETGDTALFQRAMSDLDRAVASLGSRPERKRDLARAIAMRGDLARAEGKFDSALADLQAALPLIAQSGSAADQGYIFKQYANALAESGRRPEARAASATALELLEQALPPAHPAIAEARGNLAVRMLADGAMPDEVSGLLGAAIGGYIGFINRESVAARAGIPPRRNDIARHVDAYLTVMSLQMQQLLAAHRTFAHRMSKFLTLLVETIHFAGAGDIGSATFAWDVLGGLVPDLTKALQDANITIPEVTAELGQIAAEHHAASGETESRVAERLARSLPDLQNLDRMLKIIGPQIIATLHHRGDILTTQFFEAMQVGKLDRTGSAVLAQAQRLSEDRERPGQGRGGLPATDESTAERAEALRRYQLAVAALAETEWRLDQARAADRVDAELLDTLRAEAERRTDEAAQAVRPIDSATLASATQGMHPLPLQDAMALLQEDEAILILRPVRDSTFVALAWPSPAGPSLRLGLLSEIHQAQVHASVGILRRSVTTPSEEHIVLPKDACDNLRRLLPENIVEALAHRRHVFVVASDALDLMPPHLLPVGDKMLLDLVALSTLPSVATLAALRSRRSPSSARRVAIVGDPALWHLPCSVAVSLGYPIPDLGPHRDVMCLGRLPGVRRLIADVADLLPVACELVGADATKENLLAQDFAGTPLVLFATHGLTGGVIPGQREAALVLTPQPSASGEDGLLTASQIARLRLDDVTLVIVAACDSAAGDGLIEGEGFTGLARAFFQAGARALVISHWTVDVSATLRLIHRLLAAMTAKEPVPPAEALRRAMLELRSHSQFSGAYFWAPFVVLGDGGAMLPPQDGPVTMASA